MLFSWITDPSRAPKQGKGKGNKEHPENGDLTQKTKKPNKQRVLIDYKG